MNGFITSSRYATILDLPIQLPQTELRRGRFIVAGQVRLNLGQTMRVRCFNLHLVNIITTNTAPNPLSTNLGVVSAGVYLGPMFCSSALLLKAFAPSVISLNPFQYRDFRTPGTYYFVVSNNTSNIDVTAVLTGVAKILNG